MNFDKLRRTNEPSTDLQRGKGKELTEDEATKEHRSFLVAVALRDREVARRKKREAETKGIKRRARGLIYKVSR